MRCTKIQKLMPLYVGADLDDRRQAEVAAHVRGCLGCARTLKEYRESIGAYRSIVTGSSIAAARGGLLGELSGGRPGRPDSRGPLDELDRGTSARGSRPGSPSIWELVEERIETEQIVPDLPRGSRIDVQIVRLVAAGILFALSIGALAWRFLDTPGEGVQIESLHVSRPADLPAEGSERWGEWNLGGDASGELGFPGTGPRRLVPTRVPREQPADSSPGRRLPKRNPFIEDAPLRSY